MPCKALSTILVKIPIHEMGKPLREE
jgi:hypothetical protein